MAISDSQMDTRTLCRLRQTCKSIEKFVESYRLIFSSQKNSPWIFYINMNNYDGSVSTGYAIFKKDKVNFHNIDFFLYVPGLEAFITDPFKQLSAVPIHAVKVRVFAEFRIDENILDPKIPPLLHSLRLNVEWLSVAGKCTEELLSSVNYSRLRIENYDPSILGELKKIGIQESCKELFFIGNPLTPFINCARTITSKVESLTFRIDGTNGNKFLNEMMNTIKYKVFMRKVKFMRIIDEKWNLYFEDLTTVYRTSSLLIQTLPIKYGFIIVVYGQRTYKMYELFFVENVSRKMLFDVCWRYFYPKEVTAAIRDRFLEASSDREAFDHLQKTTASLVKYDSFGYELEPILADNAQ